MRIWKIEELKSEIRQNSIAEKDKFIYLLIYVGLGYLCTELPSYFPSENHNTFDYLASAVFVVVTILGTYLCYIANGGSNGHDFCGRYFAISFVISMRFLVLFIPILLALVFYWYNQPLEQEGSTLVETLVFLAWFIALYWRMYVHFTQIRS